MATYYVKNRPGDTGSEANAGTAAAPFRHVPGMSAISHTFRTDGFTAVASATVLSTKPLAAGDTVRIYAGSEWTMTTLATKQPDVRYEVWSENVCTASNSGGDLLLTFATVNGYVELANLTPVQLWVYPGQGVLPTGTAAETDYWLVKQSATTFKLSTSATGTPLVAYSDAGSGTIIAVRQDDATKTGEPIYVRYPADILAPEDMPEVWGDPVWPGNLVSPFSWKIDNSTDHIAKSTRTLTISKDRVTWQGARLLQNAQVPIVTALKYPPLGSGATTAPDDPPVPINDLSISSASSIFFSGDPDDVVFEQCAVIGSWNKTISGTMSGIRLYQTATREAAQDLMFLSGSEQLSRKLMDSHAFTVSDSGGQLLLTLTTPGATGANRIHDGTIVRVSGASLPNGLTDDTNYYAIRVSATPTLVTLKLATTMDDAFLGNAIATTALAAGTWTLHRYGTILLDQAELGAPNTGGEDCAANNLPGDCLQVGVLTITPAALSCTFSQGAGNKLVCTVAGEEIPSMHGVTFSGGTTLPTGLVAGTKYFTVRKSAFSFEIATTRGRAAKGIVINYADAGTGGPFLCSQSLTFSRTNAGVGWRQVYSWKRDPNKQSLLVHRSTGGTALVGVVFEGLEWSPGKYSPVAVLAQGVAGRVALRKVEWRNGGSLPLLRSIQAVGNFLADGDEPQYLMNREADIFLQDVIARGASGQFYRLQGATGYEGTWIAGKITMRNLQHLAPAAPDEFDETSGTYGAPPATVLNWGTAAAAAAARFAKALQVTIEDCTFYSYKTDTGVNIPTFILPNVLFDGDAEVDWLASNEWAIRRNVFVRDDGLGNSHRFQLLSAYETTPTNYIEDANATGVEKFEAALSPTYVSDNVETLAATPDPVPSIAELVPASVIEDGGAMTLRVNGLNLADGDVVKVNGVAKTTTWVNDSPPYLNAALLSTDVDDSGTFDITVYRADPETTTAALTFEVVSLGAPVATALTPSSVDAGADEFVLRVDGQVRDGDEIELDGTGQTTTYNAGPPAYLTCTVAAAAVAAVGSIAVTVYRSGNTTTSNALTLTVADPDAPDVASAVAGRSAGAWVMV